MQNRSCRMSQVISASRVSSSGTRAKLTMIESAGAQGENSRARRHAGLTAAGGQCPQKSSHYDNPRHDDCTWSRHWSSLSREFCTWAPADSSRRQLARVPEELTRDAVIAWDIRHDRFCTRQHLSPSYLPSEIGLLDAQPSAPSDDRATKGQRASRRDPRKRVVDFLVKMARCTGRFPQLGHPRGGVNV